MIEPGLGFDASLKEVLSGHGNPLKDLTSKARLGPMLSRLQYLVEGLFESSAAVFRRVGLTPNLITSSGFVLTLIVSLLYSHGIGSLSTWLAASALLVVAGYFDALDGAMARRFLQVSRIGGILDSVLDRIGEMALYSGIALGGLVDFRICLWALCASLMVSYVRARVEAEGVKLKGVGIAERPERLLILLVSTLLFPLNEGFLVWGVGLVAVLSSITVAERVYKANCFL